MPNRAHHASALLVVGPVLLLACGPGPVAADGTEGGSAGSGVATTTGIDTGQDGTASEGMDDSTTGASTQWCLRGVTQPALGSLEYIIAIQDFDADGRAEAWMRRPQGNPVQSSRVLAFQLGGGELLEPIVDLEVDGDVWRMTDVDGDGLRDLVLRDETLLEIAWLAGLPGLGEFDPVPRPLFGPHASAWVDANADGIADIVETIDGNPGRIVLHLGDGTGGFVPAGELAYDGELTYDGYLGRADVWPTGIPGRLLVLFEEDVNGFPNDIDVVLGIEVSPAGEITTLARSSPLDVSLRHASDLDGDGVPDALGFDSRLGTGLIHLHPDVPGHYLEDVIVPQPIEGMLVGPFTADEVDALYWNGDEVLLRRRMGGAWPQAEPVAIDGPWSGNDEARVLDADGEPGAEILIRGGADDGYALWWVEPCA